MLAVALEGPDDFWSREEADAMKQSVDAEVIELRSRVWTEQDQALYEQEVEMAARSMKRVSDVGGTALSKYLGVSRPFADLVTPPAISDYWAPLDHRGFS